MEVPIADVTEFQLAEYFVPAITAYNRIEASPRTTDFNRSLKAEVRDPMWMLTRQWQFGEYQGEDAASIVTSKILGHHTPMKEVRFGDAVFPYDGATPLETVVERERLMPNLALAVEMARYFLRLIRSNAAFDDILQQLRGRYPLNYTPHENDQEGIQLLNAVRDNAFDGFGFHTAILNGSVPTAITAVVSTEIESFKKWFQRSYSQPEDGINPPWIHSQLEYRFAVSSGPARAPKQLVADHYHHGHLDWYSFDVDHRPGASPAPAGEDNSAKDDMQSYIPSPVSFSGMPAPRFWMMEDSRTDFGKISTSPTGLLHLLLAEFGLIYSNDWFMLPYRLPVNALCEMSGIVVKDVFGEHTLIRPAGRGPGTEWQRWSMFHHTNVNENVSSAANSFYLVPACINLLEGLPREQVNFLRDEMANMVWAVESILPSQAGKGIRGDELVLKKDVPAPSTPTPDEAPKAPVKYELGTTVPDNWIPFIPVQLQGSNTEIHLQRAKIPGGTGPAGKILKEKAAPYFINEEVIPRSGVQVSMGFQMASSVAGKRNLWLGRKKTAGRGEGWSNLRFDQIRDNT